MHNILYVILYYYRYFEWHKASDRNKQPYFIYFPHADSDTVDLLNKDVNDPETGKRQLIYGRAILTLI